MRLNGQHAGEGEVQASRIGGVRRRILQSDGHLRCAELVDETAAVEGERTEIGGAGTARCEGIAAEEGALDPQNRITGGVDLLIIVGIEEDDPAILPGGSSRRRAARTRWGRARGGRADSDGL